MNGNAEGKRSVGKARAKWIDVVNNDMRKTGVRNWRTEADDWDEWRRILEEAKDH